MTLIIQSLDSVTAAGAGASMMFDEPRTSHSMATVITGSPDEAEINLEGTIDGVNWYPLVGGSAGTSHFYAVNSAVVGVRANLVALDGGTSPTVTAWLASR